MKKREAVINISMTVRAWVETNDYEEIEDLDKIIDILDIKNIDLIHFRDVMTHDHEPKVLEKPVDKDCFGSPVLYKNNRVLLVNFCMENNDGDLNQEDALILDGHWELEKPFETDDDGMYDVRAYYNMVNRYNLKRVPGFNYGD